MRLTLERKAVGECELVCLEGRLDAAVAVELKQQLIGCIDQGAINLLLDLGAVEFVDSTGLSAIISALKAATSLGGEVVLLRPTGTVQSILELTRLHQVFRIYESAEAALKALHLGTQAEPTIA